MKAWFESTNIVLRPAVLASNLLRKFYLVLFCLASVNQIDGM